MRRKHQCFSAVKAGNWVIVQATQQVAHPLNDDWWMGEMNFCEGDARDPRVISPFQVTKVDDRHITWVNGDEVTHVVRSPDGMLLSA